MVKCSKCNKNVKDKSKFCPYCGSKIIKKKETKEKSLFYKINYSLVGLFVWLLSIIAFGLILGMPDRDIRIGSFLPYSITLLLIGLTALIVHLVLRRKEHYVFKGKALAITLIVLVFLTLVLASGIFTGQMGSFGSDRNCYEEYKYYTGCNRESGFNCIHYNMFGFGECDACEKRVCPESNI